MEINVEDLRELSGVYLEILLATKAIESRVNQLERANDKINDLIIRLSREFVLKGG